jgi:hypothetical protein
VRCYTDTPHLSKCAERQGPRPEGRPKYQYSASEALDSKVVLQLNASMATTGRQGSMASNDEEASTESSERAVPLHPCFIRVEGVDPERATLLLGPSR